MNKKFSDRLSELIGTKKVQVFAKTCGVDEKSIREYIKGAQPGRNNLLKIATACGVSVGWLASGEGYKVPPPPIDYKDASPEQQREYDEAVATIEKRKMLHPENHINDGINISEGRLMTDLVLMSGTQYAEALWSNLKSFAEAVRKEAQVKELERKVEAGFKQSNSEIAELKEMIRALGGAVPEKKSNVA